VRLPVLGIFVDYTAGDLGGIAVSRSLYRLLWGDRLLTRARVWPRPEADLAALRGAIAQRFGPTHGLQAFTMEEFRAAAKALYVDGALSMVHALFLLALAISVVGVVNCLLVAVLDRRSELRTLEAVGVSQTQRAAGIAAQGALIGVVGALLGTLAAVAVSRVLAVDAVRLLSGIHARHVVPVATAIMLATGMVMASMVGGLPAAWRAARRQRSAGECTEEGGR
jgi:putative ABC transport system permease protein